MKVRIYVAASVSRHIFSELVPPADTHAHIMTLPPPCLTHDVVHLGFICPEKLVSQHRERFLYVSSAFPALERCQWFGPDYRPSASTIIIPDCRF